MACRLYVITVLIQTSIDIAIEGDLFVRFHKNDADAANPDKMPAYLSIFALAQWVYACTTLYQSILLYLK